MDLHSPWEIEVEQIKFFSMNDAVLAVFVKDKVAAGETSEVYLPDMRVITGRVESRVLGLLGISPQTTVVREYKDSSGLVYSLLIDLADVAGLAGEIKVCKLEDCSEVEKGLLYTSYLKGKVCSSFERQISDQACEWAGKHRICYYCVGNGLMSFQLSNDRFVSFEPSGSLLEPVVIMSQWHAFCARHSIDPVSHERLMDAVVDFFYIGQQPPYKGSVEPSFSWSKNEIAQLLQCARLSDDCCEITWADGVVNSIPLEVPSLRAFEPLVSDLLAMRESYGVDVNLSFNR